MCKTAKIALVAALVVVVAWIIVTKNNRRAAAVPPPAVGPQASGLPRLIDLGSTTCIPCKLMAPILEELRKEYAGKMQVDFIDVNANPDAGKPYGIKLIPTEVFLDASGKELWRHEGFISKEDILAKWKELDVNLGAEGTPK